MPFNSDRQWCVHEIESTETLAKLLTETQHVLCSGFVVRGHPGYVFLNDSFIPDPLHYQEYAVLKRMEGGSWRQLDSWTVSRDNQDQALVYIEEVLSGAFDETMFGYSALVEFDETSEPGSHTCDLCK